MQQDVGAGFPVVLIRAGGEFIARSGGVAAGMSGSPVYLRHGDRDALLGAIGFTFPSSDHQLALVTPIDTMKQDTVTQGGPQAEIRPFGAAHFAGLGRPVPVATPLLLSGVSDRAAALLEPLFSGPVTPLAMQVGAGAQGRDEAYELQPGSAIAVELVRGDIGIAAVGTLTLIEGRRFWAFGHPLLGQGPVSFALVPAYVSFIVPSQVVPFKLADTGGRLLGSVTQDRPWAVSGVLNDDPGFIPVALTLHGPGGSVTKHFEVTADERYYAPLLAAASLQALDQDMQGLSAGSAELAWEITLASGRTVRLLEQVTDPADVAAGAARLAAEPLAVLAGNVFAAPEVARVALSVSYTRAQRYAEVVKVDVESDSLRAGEMLTLYVRLQPYRSEAEVRTLRVALPDDLSGPLEIVVRGGSEPELSEEGEADPLLSFDELLLALADHTQASELVIETLVDGSYQKLERLALPYPVAGSDTVSVNVAQDSLSEDDGLAVERSRAPEDTPMPFPEPPVPHEPR